MLDTLRHAATSASAILTLWCMPLLAAGAQTPKPDSSKAPIKAEGPASPAVSGVIFGNYHYLLGGPRKDFNQFVLDRAYLTVRGTPAPKLGYRLTSDVFQSGDGNGWTIRMKYAYLDYAIRSGMPWATTLRAGMLQTVTIEHHETFWPRWLGTVPVDRLGYFQSADVGAAASTRLPGALGEVYAHVVNGSGYSRRETDRYKDFGLRGTITPFARLESGPLRGLALTSWVYRGSAEGAAPTGATSGPRLERDRWGMHAALRTARVTLAAEHDRRTDELVSTVLPPTIPVTITEVTGAVTSGFAILRPFAVTGPQALRPLGLVARYDHVDAARERDGTFHYLLAGALHDVNTRLAVSLNYQEQLGAEASAPFRGLFANASVSF